MSIFWIDIAPGWTLKAAYVLNEAQENDIIVVPDYIMADLIRHALLRRPDRKYVRIMTPEEYKDIEKADGNMDYTPERIARTVTEHVAKLNHDHPGWFNRISLEQESYPIHWPFIIDNNDIGHLYELEIAWRTAISVLRLMDKENAQ